MTSSLEGQIEAIYEVEGGSVPMSYIASGHIDKDEFVVELLHEFGAAAEVKHVEHIHVRNVPWYGPDGWTMVMYKAIGPARGAYAITSVDQGWTTGGTP